MNSDQLLRRAHLFRRIETDPYRIEWWGGYIRGPHRTIHGSRFGTDEEHAVWLSLQDSPDPLRAAAGAGYRAGLELSADMPGERETSPEMSA